MSVFLSGSGSNARAFFPSGKYIPAVPDLSFCRTKSQRYISGSRLADRRKTNRRKCGIRGTTTGINSGTADKGTTGNRASTGDRETTGNRGTTEQQTSADDLHQVAETVQPHPVIDLSPEKLADKNYLLEHFFVVDAATTAEAASLNAAEYLAKDMTLKPEKDQPQILIYHSHSQETFADSRTGEEADTVVGVGDYLTEILEQKYGYQVIHVREHFDVIGGEIDRSRAYDFAREYVEKVLEENPTVQVLIDLHRDGVPEGKRLVTKIGGRDTAQIMFYNGLSYTVNQGKISYLPNPYIEENLAFSFQLEYTAAEYYPGFYRCIYLAGLRYNLHLRPRALLVEAGAQTNTVQEVKNAMEPLGDILNRVLKGSDK